MKPSHFAAYGRAYLSGLFYLFLQFALAWGVCAGRLTPEMRAHMLRFDWATFGMAVCALALPTCIAFLDGSVERGRQSRTAADPDDRPPPMMKEDIDRIMKEFSGDSDAAKQLRAALGGPPYIRRLTPEEVAAVGFTPPVPSPAPSAGEFGRAEPPPVVVHKPEINTGG